MRGTEAERVRNERGKNERGRGMRGTRMRGMAMAMAVVMVMAMESLVVQEEPLGGCSMVACGDAEAPNPRSISDPSSGSKGRKPGEVPGLKVKDFEMLDSRFGLSMPRETAETSQVISNGALRTPGGPKRANRKFPV